ncbi:MAG: ammonium transporter [Candidatus Omnitrophota bacterium]
MMSWTRRGLILMAGMMLAGVISLPVLAQEAAKIDSGDTAWIITSTLLVMVMTAPGLALFYGGLVNQRNVLTTLMHSFFCLCLVSVQWVVIGYTLSFGATQGGVIGGLGHLFFNGVGPDANGTIPQLVFAMFQCMFAVITVGLITGAYAERISFSAFVLFSLLWTTLIYDPLCHWVWGGGWMGPKGLKALDFAGGTVVHISSGVSALVTILVIGKRHGYPHSITPPHNLPFTLIGASLLWFGWFGFNAGSALAANGLAGLAFCVTNTAAATAALTWLLIEKIFHGKPTILGAATGAVAGLVAITPASGFVSVCSSLWIGAGAGIVCYIGVNTIKKRFGYDDTLDVFGVHGLGGTWGALATGLFASEAAGGTNGLFYGNPTQLWLQFVSVAATIAYAGIGTFIILKIVGMITPLRVKVEDEVAGMDLSQHGEVAYNFFSPGMSPTSH